MGRRWLRTVQQLTEEANTAFGLTWWRLICGTCGHRSPAFMAARRGVRWLDRHAAKSPNCFQFLDAKEVD